MRSTRRRPSARVLSMRRDADQRNSQARAELLATLLVVVERFQERVALLVHWRLAEIRRADGPEFTATPEETS